MKKNRNMMIDYVIDDFMIYCQEKDLRPKTIFSYETTLRLFTRYIKDNLNIENISDVKEETVKDYISYTKERGKYTIVANKNTSYINIPKNRVDFGGVFIMLKITDLEYTIEDYLTSCDMKNLTTKTIKSYDQSLKLFLKFLLQKYKITSIKELKKKTYRRIFKIYKRKR